MKRSSIRRHRRPYPLLFLPFLVGCAHTAGPPSPQAAPTVNAAAATVKAAAVARSVVLCRTTEAELRRQLGEPSRDGILHGDRIMSWIIRTESPSKYLAVMTDSRGVVVDLYWDIPTEVPWVPTNQCLSR